MFPDSFEFNKNKQTKPVRKERYGSDDSSDDNAGLDSGNSSDEEKGK